MLPKSTGKWTEAEARHLLNRAGFGGSPQEIATFHGLGREKAVDLLLHPTEPEDAFRLPDWCNREQALADARMRREQFMDAQKSRSGMTASEAEAQRRKAFQQFQQDNRRNSVEAQGWWFNRILKTSAPLREKMTLFWHDHFASSIQKVKQPVLMMEQNRLFREHAFGSFKELTQSIVRDPAMMLYLDTQRSSKAMPNENFAREVMELFTLGEGNYTEQDVKEAARAFTGFQLNRFNGNVSQNAAAWDSGEKMIFGKSGAYNGRDVVNLIFQKDACARFMVGKFWEFFAYESPLESAMEDLAKTFRDADYEVKPVLREIFLSREFYGEKAMSTQIKCPVQYLVQMLKELEMDSAPMGFPIMGQTQLGQVLFMPPNVAGWDWGKAWINTNTLLTRYNLAGALTKGTMAGSMRGRDGMERMGRLRELAGRIAKGPDFAKIAAEPERNDTEALVDGLIGRFFCVPIPEKARQSFIAYADSKKGVSFTDAELGELCHLMMSTPYYQLC
ncbi:DUF1800 domain-containing protein [Akkermansiaceae bacterium]|nr:DUF1800 domain-containing protein [Akkermansiaceae bacterium]